MESEILNEVRKITSDKLAEKQDKAKNNYPSLISRIKTAASLGETSCEFSENEINEFSKRLLNQDGFTVYATTKKRDPYDYKYDFSTTKSIWIVQW